MIDEALGATNHNANILWAKASRVERGDLTGRSLYEDLYAENSSSVMIANNLASMLATYKYDAGKS